MQPTKQHALVMWIIWFAQLQAAFVFQFFLAGGFSKGDNASEPMAIWLWLACLLPLVLSTAVRWLAIPKLVQPVQQQLVAMIVGLALAEASVLIGIFLVAPDYPQYQIGLLMVGVVSIIQFAPSYATPGYKLES
ncbi:hypothetical protein ACWPKO_05300 [Coraliomargarita sp. W4R53]